VLLAGLLDIRQLRHEVESLTLVLVGLACGYRAVAVAVTPRLLNYGKDQSGISAGTAGDHPLISSAWRRAWQ
jgi:hypothetical protein